MNPLVLNLFLAAAWVLINNAYSIIDFGLGFILGMGCLWLAHPFGVDHTYFRRLKAAIILLIYFHWEMMISVLRVTWEVLTPTPKSSPDIVHVPLDAKTNIELTLLANMVSLTPGTLSLDITPKRTHLVVHAMFAKDHDLVISGIKNGLEKKLLEVTRK